MSKFDKDYLEEAKSLSNLFKEVQDIRYGRAEAKEEKKPEIKYNRIYVVDHRFNVAGAIIGILIIILFFSAIHSNSIYANSDMSEEKVPITEFEENKKVINIMGILSSNISEKTVKEVLNKEIEIDYETQYIENSQLPKNEEHVLQEGSCGIIEQTIINTYENNELIEEKVISEMKKSDPVEKIIEVGTSEFLFDKKVYLGDTMFTTEDTYLYTEMDEDTQPSCLVYQHIDVRLLEEADGWAKIKVDSYEGYVKGEFLTSEALTPGIAETARLKRIKLSVSINMRLNKPSGLTREDYIKVFTDNSNDKNKIFEENAETFYELESKYNINGLFVAAIGIHESNWGTSNIATQKKNLFGYGSYDSDPYNGSYLFESYQYGIETVAKTLVKNYLNPAGTAIYDGETATGAYYNGPNVEAVNVRYASDPNWSNRVFEIMTYLYEKL